MEPLKVKFTLSILFTPKHTYILTLCMNILNLRVRFIIFKFYLTRTIAENVVLPLNLKLKVSNVELNDLPNDLPELPLPIRIDLAYQAWIKYRGTILARKIAQSYSVAKFILNN